MIDKTQIGIDPRTNKTVFDDKVFMEYVNLRLAALDQPVYGKEDDYPFMDTAKPLLLNYKEMFRDIEIEVRPGAVLGHKNIPVRSVCSYIPGGRYPLFGSAQMSIIPPKVAGVRNVYAFTPPEAPDKEWTIEQLISDPASDGVLLDLDGDGREETIR